MPFFGSSSSAPAPEQVDPARLALMAQAKHEIDGLSEFFATITDVCFTRCLGQKHFSNEITVAETACVDRCVVKYMESQGEVGKFLTEYQQKQQQQQQAQAAAIAAITGQAPAASPLAMPTAPGN